VGRRHDVLDYRPVPFHKAVGSDDSCCGEQAATRFATLLLTFVRTAFCLFVSGFVVIAVNHVTPQLSRKSDGSVSSNFLVYHTDSTGQGINAHLEPSESCQSLELSGVRLPYRAFRKCTKQPI
jgi:hypothetical protein